MRTDAYKGPNGYMTQVLIHVIQNEDLWPTKVVLPIRVTESEMEIQWDEYVFNNHLLGPVRIRTLNHSEDAHTPQSVFVSY